MARSMDLVTGATGFTGGALCRRLVNEGRAVRGLVRDPQRAGELCRLGVELAVGDLRDAASLEGAVRGVETVYHVAALYRPENVPTERFHEVNARGTRRLLEAAEAAGVERFLHCSTVGVHGQIDDPPADESTPHAPTDHYQRSKAEGERIALDFHRQGRVPVTVVRPAGIYGPGDTRYLKLFRAVARGRFVMIGSGETLHHLVYIDDLVEGIRLAATRPAAEGEVYILAGPRAVPVDELVAEVADAVGACVPSWRVPVAPVYAVAAVCEAVCRPLGIQPPLFRRRMDFFRKDRAFDIAKAREQLGYDPEVDLPTGVRRTAAWYRERELL